MLMAVAAMAASCTGGKQAKISGIDLSYLDTTASPATDFYQYATGGWQKNNPLKPEYATEPALQGNDTDDRRERLCRTEDFRHLQDGT